ncbi:MAG: tetratricopeptide repeat protein [Cyclobacteriaceae bacterium]|nr:tetratricopeptide repeat protein [Cyclobacteriaceae bacterium]MDH4296013.1 tetratricopeptide repeat protein [Cyclobacteriaceae bacterium]MDH5249262.1 tetratricopeptide repeat protein [Cyclobacteriaceae bacterium]
MTKVVKFPIPEPEKFGPHRVRKKKGAILERHGQLNLFSGGKVVSLNKLSAFDEALIIDDQGDREGARKLYLKAIDSADSPADAYCNLGIIEWQDGNQTKAIDYFTLSLQQDPRHFEAHYNLANLYGEIGNFQLAKAHYKISIEVEPSFPNSYFNLGLTLAMNKEFEEAVKILNQYRALTSPSDHKQANELIQTLMGAL